MRIAKPAFTLVPFFWLAGAVHAHGGDAPKKTPSPLDQLDPTGIAPALRVDKQPTEVVAISER